MHTHRCEQCAIDVPCHREQCLPAAIRSFFCDAVCLWEQRPELSRAGLTLGAGEHHTTLVWHTPDVKPEPDPDYPACSVEVLAWLGDRYRVVVCEYADPEWDQTETWREASERWELEAKLWAALPAITAKDRYPT